MKKKIDMFSYLFVFIFLLRVYNNEYFWFWTPFSGLSHREVYENNEHIK